MFRWKIFCFYSTNFNHELNLIHHQAHKRRLIAKDF